MGYCTFNFNTTITYFNTYFTTFRAFYIIKWYNDKQGIIMSKLTNFGAETNRKINMPRLIFAD